MRLLLAICCLIASLGFSQVFIPEGSGLKLYADTSKSKLISDRTFDACWCDIDQSDAGEFYFPKKEDKKRIIAKSGGWGILNARGEEKTDFQSVLPYTYSATNKKITFNAFKDTLYSIRGEKGSYLSMVDTSGTELKKFFVRADHKGHFLASEDDDAWGIANVNMRVLLKMKYDPARFSYKNFRFNENGLVVLESKGADNKYGIVSYTGQIQVGFRFDFMVDYIEDEKLIYAEINAKKGFINKHGGVVFPLIHEKLPMHLTDSNLVATEKKIWIMDKNFKQIGNYRWQKLEREGNVYFAKQNNVWGILDLDLKPIVKPQYYSIDDAPRIKGMNDFKTYVVVKNSKIGVIDIKGNVIIPCKYNCRCTLGYFAPAGYFIELANGDKAYRFNEKGEIVSEGSAAGKACLCESYD